jgi:hypothetical protein
MKGSKSSGGMNRSLAVITAKNRKTISKEIPKTLLDTPKPEQYDSLYWKVYQG